jgi:outer membrane protein TolC
VLPSGRRLQALFLAVKVLRRFLPHSALASNTGVNMKSCLILLIVLFSFIPLFSQTNSPATITLDELIQEALQNNPELRAFDAGRQAAAARIPQMSSLDDPRFAVEIEEAPRSSPFKSAEWKFLNFGLSQMLPFPGKLAKARKIAEIDAEHAQHDYEEKRLEIVEQIKAAYFNLYFIQRSRAVNQENIDLMKHFVGIAKTRYAVGIVMNQDLLKANVELAKLANEQITLQQEEEIAAARLNILLNRPPQAPLGNATLPERKTASFDLDELQQEALAHRPMIHHDALSVTQSRVANDLAKRQYWPDLDLSLKYVTSPLEGFRGWTAMAGFNLPFAFWSNKKYRGAIEETEAEMRMKEAMLNNSRNLVKLMVREALVKAQSAQRSVELYRNTILPQAEQVLQATIAGYQTGQTDFLMLLDSYRMLQMFKLEYHEAEAIYEMSLAELERAVGKKLN